MDEVVNLLERMGNREIPVDEDLIIQKLGENKLILGQVDTQGNTFLHYAVKANSYPICSFILEKEPDYVLYANKAWNTPLHIACEYGYYEIAIKLIMVSAALGAVDGELNHKNRDKKTPVELLKIRSEDEKKNRSKDMILAYIENWDTPLHVACREGNVELAFTLLKSGVDWSYRNKKGQTPEDILRTRRDDQSVIDLRKNIILAEMETLHDRHQISNKSRRSRQYYGYIQQQ